jgi:hypothetical protein
VFGFVTVTHWRHVDERVYGVLAEPGAMRVGVVFVQGFSEVKVDITSGLDCVKAINPGVCVA